jgi:hypothetical protein
MEHRKAATERQSVMSKSVIVFVRLDVDRFRRTLDDLGKQQLPYATSLAINKTARTAAYDVTRQMPAIFDRPTPFTLQAIGVKPSRKRDLRAEVFVKRLQAKYLLPEETGATRTWHQGDPILTPADLKTNTYGNIPRGALRRLKLDPKRYFFGSIKGIYGLWQRGPMHSIKLLVAFRNRATWKPRFAFRERVAASVRLTIGPALRESMARAIATARR